MTIDDEHVGTFVIYEGKEPVDAAYEFVSQHNLSLGYRHTILSEACNVVECHRLQPGKEYDTLINWKKELLYQY